MPELGATIAARSPSMEIHLPQIYPVKNPEQYKLHLACQSGEDRPLDVFVRDRAEWNGWNDWRGTRDDFNRDFIFGLIEFYPEKDRWLFGGAYRVLSRKPTNYSHSYKIEPLQESEPFIGRLKLSLKRPARAKAVNFENYYEQFVVSEIFPEPYTGEIFCGYDRIDIAFPMLERIIVDQRRDWRVALENAKGVYLITDTRTGRRYVGSAYGGAGIWSRWECYVGTLHGYNDELTRLIAQRGQKYARHFFRFALLEYLPMKVVDDVVINREAYWKKVLLSRGKFGYNKN
jgi:hypothetical protein